MTCHIARAAPSGTVIFSTSHASTPMSEVHGLQTQIVGRDFLLGGTGSPLPITTLFKRVMADYANLDATKIQGFVERVIDDELDPSVRPQLNLILATPDHRGKTLRTFHGGVIRRFVGPESFNAIGVGAELVIRAVKAQERLGTTRAAADLSDTFVAVETDAFAADDSVTVNSIYTIGLLVEDRAYLLAEDGIAPKFVPSTVVAEWPMLTAKCREILSMARAIRGEIRNAERSFSEIAQGALSPQAGGRIKASVESIAALRPELEQKLTDYRAWYDQLLSR